MALKILGIPTYHIMQQKNKLSEENFLQHKDVWIEAFYLYDS